MEITQGDHAGRSRREITQGRQRGEARRGETCGRRRGGWAIHLGALVDLISEQFVNRDEAVDEAVSEGVGTDPRLASGDLVDVERRPVLVHEAFEEREHLLDVLLELGLVCRIDLFRRGEGPLVLACRDRRKDDPLQCGRHRTRSVISGQQGLIGGSAGLYICKRRTSFLRRSYTFGCSVITPIDPRTAKGAERMRSATHAIM